MYNENEDNNLSLLYVLKKILKSDKLFLKDKNFSKQEKKDLKTLSKLLAKMLKNNANLKEPLITKDIKSLESDYTFLINLKSNIKSQNSLVRKIYNDSILKTISPKDASINIYDTIRYTLIISDNKYTEYVQNSLDKLLNEGYQIIPGKFKNRWGKETYQGINVGLISPYNTKLEVQFHTEKSYYAKENLNHFFYKIYRNPFISSELKNVIKKIMIQTQSKVSIPKNAIGYTYDNVKNKTYVNKK